MSTEMKIVDEGRQRDYETGEPVDHVDLQDSEFERVVVRQLSDDNAVVTVRTADGEEQNFAVELTDELYMGISPVDWDITEISPELHAILNYIGYAPVAGEGDIETE